MPTANFAFRIEPFLSLPFVAGLIEFKSFDSMPSIRISHSNTMERLMESNKYRAHLSKFMLVFDLMLANIRKRRAHDHESKADRKQKKTWMKWDAQLQFVLTEEASHSWSKCMHDKMHFALHDMGAIKQMREKCKPFGIQVKPIVIPPLRLFLLRKF